MAPAAAAETTTLRLRVALQEAAPHPPEESSGSRFGGHHAAAPPAAETTLRLIVPVPAGPAATVADVARAIATRLAEHGARDSSASASASASASSSPASSSAASSAPPPAFRVARLETADGFALDAGDAAAAVLRDGDAVVAVSRGAWLAAELPRLLPPAGSSGSSGSDDVSGRIFAALYAQDFHAPRERPVLAAVGVSARNRLWAALGHGWHAGALRRHAVLGAPGSAEGVSELALLDPAQVAALAAAGPGAAARTLLVECAGERLVSAGDGDDGKKAAKKRVPWAASVTAFRGDAEGTVVLELSVQPAHAASPTVWRCQVRVAPDQAIELVNDDGEGKTTPQSPAITCVADPNAPPTGASAAAALPALPAATKTGETLPPTKDQDKPKLPAEGAVKATGDARFSIALSHEAGIEVSQMHPRRPDTEKGETHGDMNVQVAVNVIVANKDASNNFAVEDVMVEHQNAAGEWIKDDGSSDDVGKVELGYRSGYYYYNRNSGGRGFEVGPHGREELAVLLTTNVKLGPNVHVWEAQRNLHRTMPNPLKLRITFKGFDGNVHVLECQADATPQDVPTKESFMKRNDVASADDLYFFAECDDVDAVGRLQAGVYKGEDSDSDHYVVVRSTADRAQYLRAKDLHRLAFQASQAGKDEILAEDLSGTPSSDEPNRGVMRSDVFALIHQGRVHALRFELETNTGKTVDYWRVPHLRSD